MPQIMQDPRIIHSRVAHDFTVHKQTVQTDQPLTIKETHPAIHCLHCFIIVANKNKVITDHFTARVILIDDRGE